MRSVLVIVTIDDGGLRLTTRQESYRGRSLKLSPFIYPYLIIPHRMSIHRPSHQDLGLLLRGFACSLMLVC
jgi:hypothetical protein